jgi:hypothetical protein
MIPLYTDVLRFKYMFNVSIHEYFSVLNVFIVCIRNTAMFKLRPFLCTHVYSYMFSTMHPPSKSCPLSRFLPDVPLHIIQELRT